MHLRKSSHFLNILLKTVHARLQNPKSEISTFMLGHAGLDIIRRLESSTLHRMLVNKNRIVTSVTRLAMGTTDAEVKVFSAGPHGLTFS